jgi:transposase
MMYFKDKLQVYVSLGTIDFRCGLDRLLMLIEATFGHAPQEPYLFLFCDKRRGKLKALFWHDNGFVLLYKRLESGKFQFPKHQAGNVLLNRLQLECLLSGMSFMPSVSSAQQKYSVFY